MIVVSGDDYTVLRFPAAASGLLMEDSLAASQLSALLTKACAGLFFRQFIENYFQ
jgi:hypothetical protein